MISSSYQLAAIESKWLHSVRLRLECSLSLTHFIILHSVSMIRHLCPSFCLLLKEHNSTKLWISIRDERVSIFVQRKLCTCLNLTSLSRLLQLPHIIDRYSTLLEGISVSEMDDWACVSGTKKTNLAGSWGKSLALNFNHTHDKLNSETGASHSGYPIGSVHCQARGIAKNLEANR